MKNYTRLTTIAAAAMLLLVPRMPARANVVLPMPAMQNAAPEALSVSGHAEIKTKPDVAYLSVSVTTQASTSDAAARQNAVQTAALIAALRGAGIAAPDIQTQSYSVEPQYDYRATPAALTGYQATNSLQVTVHDLGKAGIVLDTATRAGATQVGDLSFDLRDRKAVQRQALMEAVRDARARADALAQAAGVGVGRLLSLTDSNEFPLERPVYPLLRARAASAPMQPVTPVAPQQIVVTADVGALYAIGPP